ncbi:MAG: GTP-binding protein, partial [Gammaproteobacteria bacterium]|nr:GTP-binding protein [Gammaproteobacteria bacterium]
MISDRELISTDIEKYLRRHEEKQILKFLTCGSVDDGKSTLIGRLLHDTNTVYTDHLEAIARDTKRIGKDDDELDLSLLVDGLQAEREQGITIDVAYRYFSTSERKFIIADCPGHQQYTRNMATGASNCDLAVILIDAQQGVQTQTKHHTYVTHLLGIRHLVIAINKMDLVDYEQEQFEAIKSEFQSYLDSLGNPDVQFIPLSAKKGDNVVTRSINMDWYTGPTILSYLHSFSVTQIRDFESFRMVIQRVNHPHDNFRGYSGTLASGTIQKGQSIRVMP